MKRVILVIGLFFVFSVSGFSQVPVVSGKIDSNTILIGEPIHYTLKIQTDNGQKIKLPPLKDSLGSHFQIIEKQKMDTAISGDGTILYLTQNFTITGWDSGVFVVPPIGITYFSKSDTLQTFTDSFSVSVKTVPVDTTKTFKDIVGPYDQRYTLSELLPYIIAGLLIIALLIGAYLLVRKLRGKKETIPFVPSMPPHEVALEALQNLKSEKLWQNGKTKQYYIRLSLIARNYLEGRYGFQAPDMVNSEIETHLQLNNIDKVHQQKLLHTFRLADLVKFAKIQPQTTENETVFEIVEAFVRETQEVKTEDNPEEN